jgi:hypothetical protein
MRLQSGRPAGTEDVLRIASTRFAFAALTTLLAGAHSASATCSFPPAERDRTVAPSDGATSVPTSVRVRVSYQTGASAQQTCGAAPPAPLIRLASVSDGGASDGGGAGDDGGVLDGGGVDGGGAAVAGQWVMATDIDPRVGVIWEFRASGPLAANTTYELVDDYPATCPCTAGSCMAGSAAVFSRFTTGSGPDTGKPTFGGLVGESCVHLICAAGDTTCCGPYDHRDYAFVPAGDAADPEGNLVGVHLYVRRDGDQYDFTHPVAPLTLSDPVDSFIASAWSMTLSAGKYHAIARAFDSSGNEDTNMLEASFVFPLASEPLCADVPQDGGMDASDGSPPDFALPVDMAQAPMPAGCGCAIGLPPSERAGAAALAALLFAALLSRRAQRRSRRGGGGAAT